MNHTTDTRSGTYVPQQAGYRAFVPTPLPPRPELRIDSSLLDLLSSADRAIGRLDATTELIPNPDLFVAMYVRQEAVFSSQIEGTQASLVDILEFESEAARRGRFVDVEEVVNYVNAMNHGLQRLEHLPLSSRLIREIHEILLKDVRGSTRDPGEFRNRQNWIGPPGCTLSNAFFVPPPPHELNRLMGDLENFLHDSSPLPPLLRCGLAHAQFETIHPFLDGNGRIGRLLITFFLCWRGILKRPLLYLSYYLKQHRDDYYQRLQAVRDTGDWEAWIRFFLEGVRVVALQATETARQIMDMRDAHRTLVEREIPGTGTGVVLLEQLFETPMINVNRVAEIIGRSYPVANDLVRAFEKLGLLAEMTSGRRYRVYTYAPYLDLFDVATTRGANERNE